ncbi:MAG TPA: ATP-binding protein [Burkholderiales bacterium]|nr:ATP-binding protein [Burkholderiales bacterium]
MPDRDKTDKSLRTERASADRVIEKRQALIEKTANVSADAVVAEARDVADAVLAEARDKADQQLEKTTTRSESESPAAVVKERARADETIRDERATADETLRLERRKEAIAFAKLLPLEREKTDRYLLTERARADDAVANRDDFLGMVTHDLRDMLGGIVLSAEVLTRTAGDNEEGKKLLVETQRMQRYAARMNRLIGDLIDVASIDAGKFAVNAVPGDFNSLLDEAADTFQSAASAKNISLQVQRGETSLPGDFDQERLLQVLANLITNSIKFTARGGQVSIRGDRKDDEQHFSVSDSGQGIPTPMLESIFERFWQVGKHDRRGMGLGLYISRCIVEAHGGRIWAESEPGEGTTIHFTLPATASHKA